MNNVLIDTSVWSLALRHKGANDIVEDLTEILHSGLAVIIGPIRQELLSGISNNDVFVHLKSKLADFNDFPIKTHDYETAAEFYNICRKHGIQGSHIDFLICAVAYNNNWLIFTSDKDFKYYARHLPIRLYGNNTV